MLFYCSCTYGIVMAKQINARQPPLLLVVPTRAFKQVMCIRVFALIWLWNQVQLNATEERRPPHPLSFPISVAMPSVPSVPRVFRQIRIPRSTFVSAPTISSPIRIVQSIHYRTIHVWSVIHALMGVRVWSISWISKRFVFVPRIHTVWNVRMLAVHPAMSTGKSEGNLQQQIDSFLILSQGAIMGVAVRMSTGNPTVSVEKTIVAVGVSCDTIDTTTCIYTIIRDGKSITDDSLKEINQ